MEKVYKARKKFIERYGRIMDAYDTRTYSEYTVYRNGDICVFRVRGTNPDDFIVTER